MPDVCTQWIDGREVERRHNGPLIDHGDGRDRLKCSAGGHRVAEMPLQAAYRHVVAENPVQCLGLGDVALYSTRCVGVYVIDPVSASYRRLPGPA